MQHAEAEVEALPETLPEGSRDLPAAFRKSGTNFRAFPRVSYRQSFRLGTRSAQPDDVALTLSE